MSSSRCSGGGPRTTRTVSSDDEAAADEAENDGRSGRFGATMAHLTSSAPSDTPTTATITATKHHGLGNDFLIAVEPERPLTADDARLWCDRRRGIGADGLISATPNSDGSWQMILWNSDGSRPEVSGNGLRCLGQALAAHVGAFEPVTFSVATDGGVRTLDVVPGHPVAEVRVDMGPATEAGEVSNRWAALGVEVERQIAVDIGNPHVVALVADASIHDVAVVGPAVEADYPDGVNVHLIDVVDASTIRLYVWERGAGYTEACGSGACAAGWAAKKWGLVDAAVDVMMPGGSARIEVADDTIFLTGPAAFVGAVMLDAGGASDAAGSAA